MLLNIKSMDKFVPYYTSKEQALKWKKLGLSKHSPQYPMIKIKDIIITKGNKEKYEEENYNKFKQQYEETHKLIPVLIREGDHKLFKGYEQILLAKELGITEVPYIEKRYNITRKPKGNRTYLIRDCTGRKIYLSGKAHSEYIKCKKICEKWGLSLVVLPMYNKYKIHNKNGQCIWRKEGYTIKSLYKTLTEYDKQESNTNIQRK